MADQEEVDITIEGKTFTYSKELLISNSEYFRAMFGSNFKEKSQKGIPLQEVDAFAFKLVVEYIKSGSKEITETAPNTIKALNCANYLQFCEVEKFCEDKLFPQIGTKYCLEIYKAAEQGSKLSDDAMTYATWNCEILFDSTSFLELEVKDLSNFLRRPELNIRGKNEFIVWEKCICPWIKKDEKKRKRHLLNLITCIDYPSLKLNDINKIIDNPLVKKNALVRNFLNWIVKSLKEKNLMNIDYKDYIDLLDDKERKSFFENISKIDAVKRFYAGTPWFVAFDVDDSRGKRSPRPIILCYDCKSKTFTKLPLRKLYETFDTFCVGFRVCSIGYRFYILGGQFQTGTEIWNRRVWSYDTLTKKFVLHILKLPVNRRHYMMCVVDSVIYLIGGSGNNRIDLSSMDAYDTIKEEWLKELPNSPFNGSGSCCAHNQTILVFVEGRLYKYNVASKRWSSEDIQFTEPRSYISAVCHNDVVYLLRSFSNEIYTMNLCERRKHIRYFGSFQNNTENVCIANDTLFSFSVDDNLKNKPFGDAINIIEVIPLSEESQIKYEEQNGTQRSSSNENDLNEVNEHPGTSTEGNEDEPEYKRIERRKLNVEANHSQHSRYEMRQERTDGPVSDENSGESVQQQEMQMPQGTDMVTPVEQQLQQSPKRGIQIWDSRTSTPGFSNIPFITGSGCHGCSSLFKICELKKKKIKVSLKQNNH